MQTAVEYLIKDFERKPNFKKTNQEQYQSDQRKLLFQNGKGFQIIIKKTCNYRRVSYNAYS